MIENHARSPRDWRFACPRRHGRRSATMTDELTGFQASTAVQVHHDAPSGIGNRPLATRYGVFLVRETRNVLRVSQGLVRLRGNRPPLEAQPGPLTK